MSGRSGGFVVNGAMAVGKVKTFPCGQTVRFQRFICVLVPSNAACDLCGVDRVTSPMRARMGSLLSKDGE